MGRKIWKKNKLDMQNYYNNNWNENVISNVFN